MNYLPTLTSSYFAQKQLPPIWNLLNLCVDF